MAARPVSAINRLMADGNWSIADAGFADAAGEIDAEAAHHVARPAAAVTLQFQPLLGCENAAALGAFGMKQEIAFFTE